MSQHAYNKQKQRKETYYESMCNLFLPIPDTDFCAFLDEIDELVKMAPTISEAIKRTGITAELVSTDDGYASREGREKVLARGVNDISISGAKGRKLTDEADWESEEYRDARRNRSAVESLMFTIKHGFEFGELGRRGLDAVRAELTEKVLAYNCCRMILMKKQRREAFDKAA